MALCPVRFDSDGGVPQIHHLLRLDQTIRAVVKGVLVTAIVQGVLAGMAYVALSVPFPMGLTALTIVLAPIPFGGTGLVWLPVALYLFWVGMTGKAWPCWCGESVSSPWLINFFDRG
ncbi:MAG: AI-2E family transporter [Nitrospira sp.]|nr:AI-2E family transporter [Nitrospira sp.]